MTSRSERLQNLWLSMLRRQEYTRDLLLAELPSVPPLPLEGDLDRYEKLLAHVEAMDAHALFWAQASHLATSDAMLLVQVCLEFLEAADQKP